MREGSCLFRAQPLGPDSKTGIFIIPQTLALRSTATVKEDAITSFYTKQ